jgi:hypothetical protein
MRTFSRVALGTVASVGLVACQPNPGQEGGSAGSIESKAHAQTQPDEQPTRPTQPTTRPEQPKKSADTAMREMDKGPPQHVTFRPAEVKWQAGPPAFEKGAQMAVLEGDPTASGVVTLRLRVPDGFVIRPHWHPNVERVTVLQGTFLLGMGRTVNRDAAESLPAGTFTSMPKRMVHYAMAEGDTIIQLTTVGPWEITYVNPEDDPRRRGGSVSVRQK